MTAYTARAHTNIALLKYWGKADTKLILPTTTSISLTLNEFYTDTTVDFDSTLDQDEIFLDGQPLLGKASQKVQQFLDLVRETAHITDFAHVTSYNHVPTAAGLASSASAFAALAGAASHAAGLKLSLPALSQLARRGSGSATRSIYGGFVAWRKGTSDETSIAESLYPTIDWPIQLLTVIVSDEPKKVDSRGGMQHVMQTSPFYDKWLALSDQQVAPMEQALTDHNLDKIGQLAEANAMQMHALNASAVPPFTYLTDTSWLVITTIQTLRQQGISVYATMDAGPNVKLISHPKDTIAIQTALRDVLPDVHLQIATPGPGIKIVEGIQIS